jgi:drug/metabolite transporter (DMT)-like permease
VSGLGVLLALASSVAWGTADFGGGLVSRGRPALTVAFISQWVGFGALLVAFVAAGGGLDRRSFALGMAAGAAGGIGLAAFYRALAMGTMSIVSPIVACGAVVPFTISLVTGERPSPVAFAGASIAVAGAVLASVEERRAEAGGRAQAVVLAALAAIALGLFTYFLGLGSREGEALPTLLGARVGSLSLLLVLALTRRVALRVPRRTLAAIAAVGLCDVGANALFALASTHGLLSLVAVLGSLYPLTTVMLAHVVLGERLTPVQRAGVAVALAGVAALSAG